jgi:hypothetical protein
MTLPSRLPRHAEGASDRGPAEAPAFEAVDFCVDLAFDPTTLLDQSSKARSRPDLSRPTAVWGRRGALRLR